jgi:hypothetical protein
MFFGFALYVGLHFHVGLNIFAVILFTAFVFSLKWLIDIKYLFFEKDEVYETYRQELLGNITPRKDPDWLMKFHKFIRGLRRKNTNANTSPDSNSYTRLKASPIHGVGVFAIRDIPSGTNIFSDDGSEMVWINKDDVEKTSGETKKLYDDFCVINNGKYGCPKNFNNLTVSWYLNEPLKVQKPNVYCDENYDFIAARDIKSGEELTVDYSTYSDISEVS